MQCMVFFHLRKERWERDQRIQKVKWDGREVGNTLKFNHRGEEESHTTKKHTYPNCLHSMQLHFHGGPHVIALSLSLSLYTILYIYVYVFTQKKIIYMYMHKKSVQRENGTMFQETKRERVCVIVCACVMEFLFCILVCMKMKMMQNNLVASGTSVAAKKQRTKDQFNFVLAESREAFYFYARNQYQWRCVYTYNFYTKSILIANQNYLF